MTPAFKALRAAAERRAWKAPLEGAAHLTSHGSVPRLSGMFMNTTMSMPHNTLLGSGRRAISALPSGPRHNVFAAPVAMAKEGKNISRMVAGAAGGALVLGGIRNRNGRAVDPVRGRQTGMYGY